MKKRYCAILCVIANILGYAWGKDQSNYEGFRLGYEAAQQELTNQLYREGVLMQQELNQSRNQQVTSIYDSY